MSARSGTERRRRQHMVNVRLDDVELAVLDHFVSEWQSTRPDVLRRLLVTDALLFGNFEPTP